MSAAVGPANNGIDSGIELDPDRHALSYKGTTIGTVERWKKEILHRTSERKDSFHSMMKKWANMEQGHIRKCGRSRDWLLEVRNRYRDSERGVKE